MVHLGNIVASWFSRPRVTENGKIILVCRGCNADVILYSYHWGYPSPDEDVSFWRCPSCVNKDRAEKGLAPLGKDGRPVQNYQILGSQGS